MDVDYMNNLYTEQFLLVNTLTQHYFYKPLPLVPNSFLALGTRIMNRLKSILILWLLSSVPLFAV